MTETTMRVTALWAAAVLLWTAAATLPARADDETFGLPEAPGRDEVLGYCGACHSMRLVVQQGLGRERWAETLTMMYEDHEMPRLEPEEEKLVLDYLADHVGPDSHKERLRSQRGAGG